MLKQLICFCRQVNVEVSREYLKARLHSHPDYPSIWSIKETLAEFGITVGGYSVPRQEISILNQPFIYVSSSNDIDLKYFKSYKQFQRFETKHPVEAEVAVVLLEKVEPIKIKENIKLLTVEKQLRVQKAVIFSLFLFYMAIYSVPNFGIVFSILQLISLCGIAICWSLFNRENGYDTKISQYVCGYKNENDCGKVLSSKKAKISDSISWSDVGISFFITSFLTLLLAQVSGKNELVSSLFFIYLVAGIFPLYSIFQQAFIIKAWCRLCLIILLLIYINLIGLYTTANELNFQQNLIVPIAITTALLVAVFCAWNLLKNLILKNREASKLEIQNLMFRRDDSFLSGITQLGNSSKDNLPSKKDLIVFGKEDVPIKIVVAINPFCSPCAMSLRLLDDLIVKFPDRISVAVRFMIYERETTSPKLTAIRSILKASAANSWETIKLWYKTMGAHNLFQTKEEATINSDLDVNQQIDHNIEWSKRNEIKVTPTFFFNGNRLPTGLIWKDGLYQVERILERE